MELNKTNEKTEKELQIAKYKKNLAIGVKLKKWTNIS